MSLYQELRRLQEGASFESFAASSTPYWAKLVRRRAPPYFGAEVEDLVQEVLIELWSQYQRYDAEKYTSLAAFLRWHADKVITKRLAQIMQNPRDLSVGFWLIPMGDQVKSVAVQKHDLIDQIHAKGKIGQYLRHATPRDRVLVMAALEAGGTGAGAAQVYADEELRRELGFQQNSTTAHRAIRRAIRRAVVRTIERTENTNDNDTTQKECIVEENHQSRRGGSSRQGQGRVGEDSVSRSSRGGGRDGLAANGAPRRRKSRPRRSRQQLGDVVPRRVA